MLRDRFLTSSENAWSTLDVLARNSKAQGQDLPDEPFAWQCVEGLRIRISEVGRLSVPGMFGAYGRYGDWLNPSMIVYLPLFGLLALGWRRLAQQDADVLVLTFPLYFLLHVCWPSNQSGRYLAPMLPLLLTCLWFGLRALGERRKPIFRCLEIGRASCRERV